MLCNDDILNKLSITLTPSQIFKTCSIKIHVQYKQTGNLDMRLKRLFKVSNSCCINKRFELSTSSADGMIEPRHTKHCTRTYARKALARSTK